MLKEYRRKRNLLINHYKTGKSADVLSALIRDHISDINIARLVDGCSSSRDTLLEQISDGRLSVSEQLKQELETLKICTPFHCSIFADLVKRIYTEYEHNEKIFFKPINIKEFHFLFLELSVILALIAAVLFAL